MDDYQILMMTNTFTPHVGGVARSVCAFTEQYRRLGHRVVVVAPEFEGMPDQETDVVRIPSLQNFNGSDFSVAMSIPGFLAAHLEDFTPAIVHSHHPFLLGNAALRVAHKHDIPLVFTHHTMYEHYTHYVPGDSLRMKEFAIQLSTGYANLCDCVIAPSESVAEILSERGVHAPIKCIPTGVDAERFARGDGAGFRRRHDVPSGAWVVGHLGRLAPEKNLGFLAHAVAAFLACEPRAHFLVIGSGPSEPQIREIFDEAGVSGRLHLTGTLQGEELFDAYHAMDVFAFASFGETQGMVLTEAMAAGVPVVALDAPGVREVVRDEVNGRLLGSEDREAFVEALVREAARTESERETRHHAARCTAMKFSMDHSARDALQLYSETMQTRWPRHATGLGTLETLFEQFKSEWELLVMIAGAAGATLNPAAREVEHD